MTKTEQILKQTCPACQSLYQLIETHQANPCGLDCLAKWKQTLDDYYQQQIILHLAHQEAQKEEHD